MKKSILIVSLVVVALILSFFSYSYFWGGKPYIENFEEVSHDYELVADLALQTYNELNYNEDYLVIDIYDGNFKCNDVNFSLTDSQQNAVRIASEKYDFLRVSKDAVFFWEDETGYYGLVYSKHPLTALYKAELPLARREYHRINSCWYEWGVWGI